jgi:CheY-like chemotaxis protein
MSDCFPSPAEPVSFAAPMATLLLVEDDTDGREALCAYLARAGHTVECVPNGKDALAAVIARPPDLVILDLFMPEMDGGNFLEVIRSYLRLQSLPVIILTGLPDSPMVERARHLRVNTILVKGKATLEEIAEAVRTELHRAPQ